MLVTSEMSSKYHLQGDSSLDGLFNFIFRGRNIYSGIKLPDNFQIWHIVYQHELFSLLYIQYLPYEKTFNLLLFRAKQYGTIFVIFIKIKFEAVFS